MEQYLDQKWEEQKKCEDELLEQQRIEIRKVKRVLLEEIKKEKELKNRYEHLLSTMKQSLRVVKIELRKTKKGESFLVHTQLNLQNIKHSICFSKLQEHVEILDFTDNPLTQSLIEKYFRRQELQTLYESAQKKLPKEKAFTVAVLFFLASLLSQSE